MIATFDWRRIRFSFLVLLVSLLAPAALPIPARSQTIEWIRQFGSTGSDEAKGVATDGTSVYVAGVIFVSLPGQVGNDVIVRKYDSGGNELWTRQFGSTSNDGANAVAAVGSDVYVVGETSGILQGQTAFGRGFIRRYDSNGNEQWTRQVGSFPFVGVAAEGAGIYVVASDALVRKYDANGNEQWTRQLGSNGAGSAIAVDSDGIYLVGSINGTLPGQTGAGFIDAFIRKYDANGNEQWTRRFGTPDNDRGQGVVANATGVYVAGWTLGTLPGQTNAGSDHSYLRKYDANGNEQWTRQFTGDIADGVAGNALAVYVAGYTTGALPGQISAGGNDAIVHKYDPDGNEVWARQFGTAGTDQPWGVAADATGVYLAGATSGSMPGQTNSGGSDAFVARLIQPAPTVSEGGVVNNASYAQSPSPVAPGSIAAVFGSSLNDGSTVLSSSFGQDGKLVTSLGGASVTINNTPAPLFYSTPGQLGIQIPFELAGQTTATIQVTVGGQTSVSRTVFLDALAPGIFTLSQDGRGTAAVLHQDGVTLVTAQNPAHPNEVVIFFATGLGTLTPALATGAPSVGNRTVATPTVTIDGVAAAIDFSGAAPNFVGLNQVNVRIPENTRSGPNTPVVLSIGGKQSNPVTIAVSP